MSIKVKYKLNNAKRKTKNCIIKILDPLAKLEMNLYNRRYRITVNKLTKDKAIKIFTNAIVNYVVRYPTDEHHFIVATFVDENYITEECMANFNFRRYFKNKKGKIAHSKFGKSIDFQLKVIDVLKNIKDLEVEEFIDNFGWSKPRNYQKSVIIKLRGIK
ncbi:hypothetical protein [Bacillus altitudinis]|uniref:hypothetical protein n=1 Tax=Bacillus altitudinis TaxID=293387 RepID=UPI001F60CD4E|nr:hypothetical protein [Bacillus altitudinis]